MSEIRGDPREDQNYSTGKCKGCDCLDQLYKGFCKPCFDKRGMKYDYGG